jgi:uncharacterized membrane protein
MITRTQLAWMAAVLFIEMLATTWVVMRLPDRVPMHWNLAGEVDRYGSPWEFELFGPPMTLLVVGLVAGLPLIPTIGKALARSGPMYGRIGLAIVTGIAVIHLTVVLPIARAYLPQRDGPHGPVTADQIASPLLIAGGILFMVLGNWMPKVRRNSVFGVRTTQTLASDAVWERTQRFSGRLFVLLGLTWVVLAVVCPLLVTVPACLVLTISYCAVSHIYAWRIARSGRSAVEG